jgi:hypothetical protein
MSDCSYILINVEHQAAYIVGICILAVYLISLLMVPVWSTEGVVMRFVLTPKFEERPDFASQDAIQGRGWTSETVLLCAPALPFSVIVQITKD